MTANIPECRVWWADTRHRPADKLLGVLSDTERARAARFHREQDRIRFITACWLLRSAAGALLDTAPAAVPLDRRCDHCGEPHGKPRIIGSPVDVSISHSGTRVGAALSLAGPVGIDLEEIQPMPGGIAWSMLTPTERTNLRRLPETNQLTAFLHIWTCKEAALKAIGEGLRLPPNQIEVAGPGEKPALLHWPLRTPPESITMHTLNPGHKYLGTAAVLTHNPVKVSQTMLTRAERPELWWHPK